MSVVVFVLIIYYLFFLIALLLSRFYLVVKYKTRKNYLIKTEHIFPTYALKLSLGKVYACHNFKQIIFSNSKSSTTYLQLMAQVLFGKSFSMTIESIIALKKAGIDPFLPIYKHEEYDERISYVSLYFLLKRFKFLELKGVKCNLFVFVKNRNFNEIKRINRLVNHFKFKEIFVRIYDVSLTGFKLLTIINLYNTNNKNSCHKIFKSDKFLDFKRDKYVVNDDEAKLNKIITNNNFKSAEICLKNHIKKSSNTNKSSQNASRKKVDFSGFKNSLNFEEASQFFSDFKRLNCVVKNMNTKEVLKKVSDSYFDYKDTQIFKDENIVKCIFESTFDFETNCVLGKIIVKNLTDKNISILVIFGNKFDQITLKNVFCTTMQTKDKTFNGIDVLNENQHIKFRTFGEDLNFVVSTKFWSFYKKIVLQKNQEYEFNFAFFLNIKNLKEIEDKEYQSILKSSQTKNIFNDEFCEFEKMLTPNDMSSPSMIQKKLNGKFTIKNITCPISHKIDRRFEKVISSYRSFLRLKVFSENKILNYLINDFLPLKIIENKICNYYDKNASTDFKRMLNKTFYFNCRDFFLAEKILKKPQNCFLQKRNFFESYFNLVFTYFGIWQSMDGIHINQNKIMVVDRAIIKMFCYPAFLRIEKTEKLASKEIIINGVSFSNLNFIRVEKFLNYKYLSLNSKKILKESRIKKIVKYHHLKITQHMGDKRIYENSCSRLKFYRNSMVDNYDSSADIIDLQF